MIQIVAGKSTAYAINVRNEVYGWGSNDKGQICGSTYNWSIQYKPVVIGKYVYHYMFHKIDILLYIKV